MLRREGDALSKIRQTFRARSALAICPGDFGAVGNGPGTVLFDNRRELVAHEATLTNAPEANRIHG
jgi:hypothetical protein